MILIAQVAPPPQPEKPRTRIEAPGSSRDADEAINGSSFILPPGDGPSKDSESAAARKKRLQRAGVLPEDPPPPPNWFARKFKSWTDDARDKNGLYKATLRTEGNIGPWFALKPQAGSKVTPNFSYGFNISYRIDGDDIEDFAWATSHFIGFAAHSFNGGSTFAVTNAADQSTQVYADINTTYYGFSYLSLIEKPIYDFHTHGFLFKAEYLPIGEVKALYDSSLELNSKKPPKAKFVFNAIGMGVTFGYVFSFARVFDTGVFTSFQVGTPTQVAARYGIFLSLMGKDKKEIPKEEPKPEPPVKRGFDRKPPAQPQPQPAQPVPLKPERETKQGPKSP